MLLFPTTQKQSVSTMAPDCQTAYVENGRSECTVLFSLEYCEFPISPFVAVDLNQSLDHMTASRNHFFKHKELISHWCDRTFNYSGWESDKCVVVHK